MRSVRSRAYQRDLFNRRDARVARRHDRCGWLSPGRNEALRVELGQRLLDLLLNEVKPDGVKVSRSIEIRQFEPQMYFNDHDLQNDHDL